MKQIQLLNKEFSLEMIKTYMKQCIGSHKAVHKDMIIGTLIPNFSHLNELEQYYYRDKFQKALTTLRRQDFWIMNNDGMLFVPTKLVDIEEYENRIHYSMDAMKRNIKSAKRFVEQEKWKALK